MYNNSAGNYYRQIKLTHCCIHADGIDFLHVNEAKTLKKGTLKQIGTQEGPKTPIGPYNKDPFGDSEIAFRRNLEEKLTNKKTVSEAAVDWCLISICPLELLMAF